MAYVQETKVSIGDRIAKAAKGAFEGATQAINLQDKLKNSQSQRDALKFQQQQMTQEAEMQQQQIKVKSISEYNNLLKQSGGIENEKLRKSFLKQNAPLLQNLANMGGIAFDQSSLDYISEIAGEYTAFSQKSENYMAQLQGGKNNLNPTQVYNDLMKHVTMMPQGQQELYSQMAQELTQEIQTKSLAQEGGLEMVQAAGGKAAYKKPEPEDNNEPALRDLNRKQQSMVLNQLKDFRDKDGKTEIEALGEARKIKSLLSSGDNQAAINLAKTMFVRLAGDPRPSDADLERISPNPSILNRLKRTRDALFLNKGFAPDGDALSDIADTLIMSSQEVIKGKIKSFSEARHGLLDMDAKELQERITQAHSSLLAPLSSFESREGKEEKENKVEAAQGQMLVENKDGQTQSVPDDPEYRKQAKKLGWTIVSDRKEVEETQESIGLKGGF